MKNWGSKIGPFLVEVLSFLIKKILVFDLALCVLIGLSFFVWGPFSYAALSDRMIWTGIGVALIAGILVSAQTTGGRNFGVPGQFIGATHGQTLLDFNLEVRQAIEDKMGVFPRMFVIGAILFGLGALVSALFGVG